MQQDITTTMTRIGHIEREQRLNDDESLVILRVMDDTIQHYVTIATHLPNERVRFRATEPVRDSNAIALFLRRAMFNGIGAEKITNKTYTDDLNDREMIITIPP